jgi:creatinine amidohydrolase
MRELAELTFVEARDALRRGAVPILPVGATEAHGPHLPLATDVIIAVEMAREATARLAAHGIDTLCLPPIAYSCAPFAAGFAGTLSIRAETLGAILVDIGESLRSHGARVLAIANAHLDPSHVRALHEAVTTLGARGLAVAFPDVTQKPWALRLTEEFRSGACHAGRYEGSIVLATRPELVRDDVRRALAPNPISLPRAAREGKSTFEEAGGPDAYFGDPAAATAHEGRETLAVLGAMLEESIRATLGVP